MKEIKEFKDFEGQDGYLIIDGLDEQTPGGKKLLSELGGSNVPNYPTDVATSDTKRYNLSVHNQAGDLQVEWEEDTYYDVSNKGGLVKGSAGNTISFSIYTGNAHDGDVLTYNGTKDDVEWTEPAGGGSNPLPDDVVWTIKSGLTPEYPEKTDAKIECYITGIEDGKAKLSWIWKVKPDGSGTFEGPVQSGAFDW